jgi:hypothetical protein
MGPVGLLLVAGTVDGESVRRALDEQRGPAWDATHFDILAGIDAAQLAQGVGSPGGSSAVVLRSAGWWLRPLDEVADLLAAISDVPVLALVESEDAGVSGYHLAVPGGAPRRHVVQHPPGAPVRAWVPGLLLLLGRSQPMAEVASLREAVAVVSGHAEQSEGRSVLALLQPREPAERSITDLLRGRALVAGQPWRPGSVGFLQRKPPRRMQTIVLAGPVRLPGPPRHAVATRAEVVATVREVMEHDGWVCLVPEHQGAPARFGTAVQVAQFAPMEDGRWMGVLHPWTAVTVGAIRDRWSEAEPVPQEDSAPDRLAQARTRLHAAVALGLHPLRLPPGAWVDDPDPARLIAWQVPVGIEASLTYLAAKDPAARAEVLSRVLSEPPTT